MPIHYSQLSIGSLLVLSYQFLTMCLQQNNLFKAREEKYQSRIKVLEALASETREESEVTQKDLSSDISRSDPFYILSNLLNW